MKSIAEDTPLIPEIIAGQVCAEAGELARHIPSADLCLRAEIHYHMNAPFRRKMRSARCREWLTAFMRHWLASVLLRNGVRREELPEEWNL